MTESTPFYTPTASTPMATPMASVSPETDIFGSGDMLDRPLGGALERPTPAADLDPTSPGPMRSHRAVRFAPTYRPVRKWRRPAVIGIIILAAVVAAVVFAQWVADRKKKAKVFALAEKVANRIFGNHKTNHDW